MVLVWWLGYFYSPVCHSNKISSLSSTFPRRMNSNKFPSALFYVLVLTWKKKNCCKTVQHLIIAMLALGTITCQANKLCCKETGTLYKMRSQLLSSKISNFSAQHCLLVLWDIQIPRTKSQRLPAGSILLLIKKVNQGLIYIHVKEIKQSVLYRWIKNSVNWKSWFFF